MKKTSKLLTIVIIAILCALLFVACNDERDGENDSQTYALTLEKIGLGTVSGDGSFKADASITVTATANSGYTFDGWYQVATKISSSTSYTFFMPSNALMLTAKFVETETVSGNMQHILTYAQNNGTKFVDDFGEFLRLTEKVSTTCTYIFEVDSSCVITFKVSYTLNSGAIWTDIIIFGYTTINDPNPTFRFLHSLDERPKDFAWVDGTGIVSKTGETTRSVNSNITSRSNWATLSNTESTAYVIDAFEHVQWFLSDIGVSLFVGVEQPIIFH